MASFPERLKQLRESVKLTQIDLAKKLGMSKGAVGNYEAGVRRPRQEDMEAIADFFNVSIDYLVGRSDKRPEFSLEERWIIDLYRKADPHDRDTVKQVLSRYQEDTVSSAG